MPLQRLVTLTPHRLPTHHALMLGEEDSAAWLLADRALWHPTLLAAAGSLPELADAGDHGQPQPDTLYAVPATPTPFLPDDWDERVRAAGAAAFRTGPDWSATLANLRAAVPGHNLGEGVARAVFGLGFAFRIVQALAEAMEHQLVLDTGAFVGELTGGDTAAAARRLLAARDVLYPATVYLINLASLPVGRLPAGACLSLVATAEELKRAPMDQMDAIRHGITEGRWEFCGGVALERPDAVLPVESQLWNLRRGRELTDELFGHDVTVFARRSGAFHPYLPDWLGRFGLSKVLYVPFDGAAVPHHAAASIRWPGPAGRAVDALTRAPQAAGDPQTFFHLAYYLHQTIMHDSAAVFVLRHDERPAGPWFDDWLALSELAPVLGTWTTAGRFLEETSVGEYATAATADDYAPEELETAVNAGRPDPVSAFARHARLRRRLDAAYTYLGLLRSLGTAADGDLLRKLAGAEDALETDIGTAPPELEKLEREAATQLARRLTRSGGREAGLLVLNPSGFARRVGLEHDQSVAAGGPVKAIQRDGDVTRFVVEVPGLGFAWVPQASGELPPPRMTLAEDAYVRNEFFEAEVDPESGGLRSFRDARNRANHLGHHLVWQPGSTVRATDVRITACGAALGEITTTGEIVDDHGERLAGFRQRYRAWLGRPLLEVNIEITPDRPAVGYPWHAYYGARFAWRDERAALSRGVFGHSSATTHHRPGSPDFLELRAGRSNVVIVTGGLPFAQRHGPRMLDVILMPAGETATSFDLYLGVDRAQPAQAAQGVISPVAVVAVEGGAPAVGPSGWLAHLDASHLLLTSLRPDADGHGVTARIAEVSGQSGHASFRWARDPASAEFMDANCTIPAGVTGDAVSFTVAGHALVDLRVAWD